MRYKYDRRTGRRCTTVELIEEETDYPSDRKATKAQERISSQQRLGIKVEYWETDLRDKVKAAGGIWRPRHKFWELRYKDVIALGLESRVVRDD